MKKALDALLHEVNSALAVIGLFSRLSECLMTAHTAVEELLCDGQHVLLISGARCLRQ
jgi:hypothetical protein